MSPPADPRVRAGYASCAETARRAGSSFAIGMRLLPAEPRRALAALYWFAHSADEAVDAVGSPELAARRLAAVRSDLALALGGDPPDERWAALADTVQRFAIPPALPAAILDGVARDLDGEPFADWDALRVYCWGVAGAVGLASLRIFGGEGAEAERAAEETGYAFQLTNILRDLGEDAGRGRWYLPLDESARFGVSPGDVAAGRPGAGFPALVAFQAERARAFYGAVPRLCARLPRSTRACPAALAGVYRGLLERVAADPATALTRRVRLSTPAKAARAFAAAGRALLGSRA
ncbi:MAG TPA: squalene/phytoene synthase family protein [Gemmatimonadota bacterium]|nr:squalene/phytoene synthase family protein [Gemmatimonadota bacterium]